MTKYIFGAIGFLISNIALATSQCQIEKFEITLPEIQNIIAECAPLNPYSIKQDQFVALDQSQQIDVQAPLITAQRLDQVTARAETNQTIDLTFKVQKNELDEYGSWQSSIIYQDVQIEKSSKVQLAPFGKLKSTDAQVQFVNFKSRIETVPVPKLVQEKPDCGGIANCSQGMKVFTMNFDSFSLDPSGHYEKTSYQMSFGLETPNYVSDWQNESFYLTTLVRFCSLSVIPVQFEGQSQLVPVQQCRDLKDFSLGR